MTPCSVGYYHTFQTVPGLGAVPDTVTPWSIEHGMEVHYAPDRVIHCPRPCGQPMHLIAPRYREARLIVCSTCGSWHSVYFQGVRGPKELIEDHEIEVQLYEEENNYDQRSLHT